MNLKSGNDRALDELLSALRDSYTEQPPERIEALLLARLRSTRHARVARRAGTAAALAAGISLLFWLVPHKALSPPNLTPSRAASERTELTAVSTPLVTKETAPETTTSVVAHKRKNKAIARSRPRVAAGPLDAEQSSPFLAVPYAEPLAPSEQLDIYRVRLPRTALTFYGVPTHSDDLGKPVTAEVAVGSDGVVRAVRFVR